MTEDNQEQCKNLSDSDLLDELRRRMERSRETTIELQALNHELKEVNEKLKASELLKSHFISNITNEIVNPFTSIIGLSRSILSVDKESWKTVISMVALIHSEAFSLDFQFRNIFFAAKFEAGEEQPNIVRTDLVELVNEVIDHFRFELRKRQMEVKVNFNLAKDGYDEEERFYYQTDSSYVRLVLVNLLSNAINFSTESRAIELSVRVGGARILEFRMKDYGIGIAPEKQRAIFDRFSRANDSINSLNRGHGLGLSVCKAIAEMLNGTLEVESELGKGATFIFTIPEAEELTEGFAGDDDGIFFEGEETF